MSASDGSGSIVLPDPGAVEHRLITIRKSVRQLQSYGPMDLARLDSHEAAGVVVERILALLDDLALQINRKVSADVLGESPGRSDTGFAAAARAGLIDEQLAGVLGCDEGPHYLQVQLCLDDAPDRIASIVAEAIRSYGEYSRQVQLWIQAGKHAN